jgi:hypothetical protein
LIHISTALTSWLVVFSMSLMARASVSEKRTTSAQQAARGFGQGV